MTHEGLRVTIVSAEGIHERAGAGVPESYCECLLEGEGSIERFRTDVWRGARPGWMFEQELSSWACSGKLVFRVLHEEVHPKPHVLLGQAELQLSERQLHSGGRIEKCLPLDSAGQPQEGSLKVLLELVPAPSYLAEKLAKARERDVTHQDSTTTRSIMLQPGPIGLFMDFATGYVRYVVPNHQAAQLGVQIGWVMVDVNGEPYTESLLRNKVFGSSQYSLVFEVRKATQLRTESRAPPCCPKCARPLVYWVTDGEGNCDGPGCPQRVLIGQPVMDCAECNWFLCSACHPMT